ncbi:hypothetical protein FG05_06488 [Fusarium graminearum]|nr:hypothetical protein FG05_06488 [Fusarium graminearum]
MLLLSGRTALSWWAKSILGNYYATKNLRDGNCTQVPWWSHSKGPGTSRCMSAKDVKFSSVNAYRRNTTEKLRIVDLVATKAIPGAKGAVVVNGWHTSPSEKQVHCTVDYTDGQNRRITRAHIIQEPTKEKK